VKAAKIATSGGHRLNEHYPHGLSGRGSEGGGLTSIREITIGSYPLQRLLPIVGESEIQRAEGVAAKARDCLRSRAIWNINSTASGGGVAEMLHSLLPYARGAGVDARWLVISGRPDFFRVTKRLHHALHGSSGDGPRLGNDEREIYDRTLTENADEIAGLVKGDDVVLLHDPQTLGLAPALAALGCTIIWRAHVGTDQQSEATEQGWAFLAPYLAYVAASVFSRQQYVPRPLNKARTAVIPPSIDPFSPKNQTMSGDVTRAILVHTGLMEGPTPKAPQTFVRSDGSPGRVDRCADIIRLGRAPSWETPVVVQISRWDPLKDPAGVMDGFVHYLHEPQAPEAELILAGPNVQAISDDPEAPATLDAIIERWRGLPHNVRDKIHLACLPMADVEENAAIVNALQRHAAVVVQKSLQEGFGLTVTEAMWKARPILASAVGGIRDQIDHEIHGLLLENPADLLEFASSLRRLLTDKPAAEAMAANARERVRAAFLPLRHLGQYAALLEELGCLGC